MATRLGGRAVVIGGSIAGLTTARALSDFFDQVVVFERDPVDGITASRKSTPQANHVHVLLLGGQRTLERFYPGFIGRLEALGGIPIRGGRDTAIYLPGVKAYSLTGSVREPHDLGHDIYSQSRGLLEHCIRESTRTLRNVELRSGTSVEGLVWEKGRVAGVRIGGEGDKPLMADLVVDAGGRGSRAPRWLTEAGFAAPEETTIGVDFAYASAKFRIPGFNGDPERVLLVGGAPPNIASGALLEPIEGGLWHLSLAGRFGDYPPANEEGFLAFAKGFHTKRIYELISGAERVSEITQYRFPTSLQRHYERLGSFPDGFVVIGDAVCSFNPVYGQGMSSAVLQAEALHDILTERAAGNTGINGLPLAFFAKAAEVIAVPWTLAANFDFAFPQTKGERPPGLQEGLRYFLALDALQVEDVEVQRLLFEVFGLAKPLSTLTDEPLRSRVLAKMQQS